MAKVPNAEAESRVTTKVEEGVQKIEVVMKNDKPDRSFVVNKHFGEKIVDGKKDSLKYTFLSTRKELAIFSAHNTYIQFKHHHFTTDDLETANMIRENGLFNAEIFENEFPEHVKKRIEEDRKWITRDSEMFTS